MAAAPPAILHERGDVEFLPLDEPDEEDETPQIQFYKSMNILGTLFRMVDERKIWDDDIHAKFTESGPPFWEQLLAKINSRLAGLAADFSWDAKREQAWRLRNV